MNSHRTPTQPIEALDRLTVSEARRLLSMIALEIGGFEPTGREECHCVHCTHSHKKKGNTPSLSVKPKRKKDEVLETPDEAMVGPLICRGNCGYKAGLEAEAKKTGGWASQKNRLSKYIQGVLPNPKDSNSWKEFWTNDKIRQVVQNLKSREQFSLGLYQHCLDRGYPLPEGARESLDITHSNKVFGGTPKSPALFLGEWQKLFDGAVQTFDNNPSVVMAVCRRRGWSADTLREMVKDGILALHPSTRHEGDVLMAFAYRGLVSGAGGLPCRLIKTRHLFSTPETDAFSRSTIHPGVMSALLGDFTSSKTLIQDAKRVVLVEGEPDAISWRHIHPEDGIICVGDVNEYKPIIECLPLLNLKGKEVVYVQDRDATAENKPKITKDGLAGHLSILKAIAEEHPAKIMLWVCPQADGVEMKDPNDFLKAGARAEEILSYARTIYSNKETNLTLPKYQAAFSDLFRQRLRQSDQRECPARA